MADAKTSLGGISWSLEKRTGCGLESGRFNKLYTVLKIDEVNNLGAARIRIRSLLAAMNQRQARGIRPQPKPAAYHRSEFTKEMYQSGYTILAPQMSPIHFDLLEPIFKKYVVSWVRR